jgi:predicted ATPase/DNA-binding XRE family transcriptional regulator
MTENISFGKWLRQRRRTLDLSQQALADQAACARITLSRIEADTLKPSKELALILLEKVGIPQNERDQWVRFARGLSELPSQEVQPYPRNNLPASLTTFIGREKEQIEIIKQIKKYRLVTLTGPGGVGKTRLSIKVGEQMLGDYVNGIWLVELASLNDPALLPQTVVALFRIAAQIKTSPTELLINFLRAKTILLILDNCEHLLEACAQLADTLLKNCPNLKILATSRESLGITGEAVYSVPSLGLPDLEQLLENFRGYESVRLFEERAQLAKMDFSLTMEHAASVAQICHRLDGIPLAIELAAAHAKMFSTEQIATQLNESFNLLTGGSRTALPRQQTIHASIDWSWNLLSDSERILLRRLSVFAGGWTLEAAESVSSGNGIESHQILDVMTQLVAKSLVVANQESGRARRYHLLETIRQYANEKLDMAGEETRVRDSHLDYYMRWAEETEPKLKGAEQMLWLDRVETEHNNLRTALAWSSNGGDVIAGLRLASALWWFWRGRIYQNEARERIAILLARPEAAGKIIWRARALNASGFLTQDNTTALSLYKEALAIGQELGDKPTIAYSNIGLAFASGNTGYLHLVGFAAGLAQFRACLQLFRELGDHWATAWALSYLGRLSTIMNDFTEAQTCLDESLTIRRELGDKWGIASSLVYLAALAHRRGDHDLAFSLSNEGLMAFREIRYTAGIGEVLLRLGLLAIEMGEHGNAHTFLEEGLLVYQEAGNKRGTANALNELGELARLESNYERAGVFYNKSLDIARELEVADGIGQVLNNLGMVAYHQGEYARARVFFTECLNLSRKMNLPVFDYYFIALAGLAGIAGTMSHPLRAARLLGVADKLLPPSGARLFLTDQIEYDRILAAVRAQLDDEAFNMAYKEGGEMTVDEAVAYALDTKN